MRSWRRKSRIHEEEREAVQESSVDSPYQSPWTQSVLVRWDDIPEPQCNSTGRNGCLCLSSWCGLELLNFTDDGDRELLTEKVSGANGFEISDIQEVKM
jgi:hypothetical protein